MRKIMIVFLICCCIGTANIECAITGNEISTIENSLIRWLCFESYWEWIDRPSSTLSIKIRLGDKKTFHIWINDFEVTENYHMAEYFVGRLRNGHAAIYRHEGYNINLIPPVPGYVEHKSLFETKDVVEDVLTIPADCTPHYDPTTPQKELMLSTVVSTMQIRLGEFARMGVAQYPKELTIIIADFNIDYPSTYILIEQTKKLYSVTLHNPQNYDSDEYERSGEYPFGEVYNKSKILLTKIRKHGIVKKIVLTP